MLEFGLMISSNVYDLFAVKPGRGWLYRETHSQSTFRHHYVAIGDFLKSK